MVEDIIDHCPPRHRSRLIYLDPSDREWPVPLNLFDCGPGENKDSVCSQVIAIFKKLFGDSWGFLLEDLLRSLTLTMLEHQLLGNKSVSPDHRYNATLRDAHDFLFSKTMRQQYYHFIGNDMVRGYWRDFYDSLAGNRKDEEVSWNQIRHSQSTTNKLRRFLLNSLTYDIFCNRDRRNPLNLRSVMDEGKVLLVNLSKGQLGEDNSALLGSVLLAQLAVAALGRPKTGADDRRTFHVIADEFQSFATDSFKLLLSEARKYGITLTIAHQHLDQLDHEMRGAALNCGSMVAFRLTGRDALPLSQEFDHSPTQKGWKYEQVMEVNAELEGDRLLRVDPEAGPLIDRLIELRERELDVKGVIPVDHFSPWETEQPLLSPHDRSRVKPRSKWRNAGRAEEIDREKAGLYAELASHLDHATWFNRRYTPPRIDSKFPVPRGYQSYWSALGTAKKGQNMYRRVPDLSTYAERQREIANSLAQQPNYNAFARFADGRHVSFRSLPLPNATSQRGAALDELRRRRRKFAVPPSQRASIRDGLYISGVRRQQADEVVYDAEVEDAVPEHLLRETDGAVRSPTVT